MSKRVDDLADVAPGPFRVDEDFPHEGRIFDAQGQPVASFEEHIMAGCIQGLPRRFALAFMLYPELARLANAAIASAVSWDELGKNEYDERAHAVAASTSREHSAALSALLARIGGGQ